LGLPSRNQENIPFSQRHVELRGQVENHPAAWLRPPVFEKTQMAGGNFRVTGEMELAQAAALAPFAEKIADRSRRSHEMTIAQAQWSRPLRQG
jgi:hypothetical protein